MPASSAKRISTLMIGAGLWLALSVGCQQEPGNNTDKATTNASADAKASGTAANLSQTQRPGPRSPSAARPAVAGDPVADTGDGLLADGRRVLTDMVHDDGLVRYSLLLDEASTTTVTLQRIRDRLAQTSPSLDGRSVKADLINAFNMTVLAQIADQLRREPGLQTVRDISGFFDTLRSTFRGQSQTLNDLEIKLVAMGDPRVFAALVRGTMSCPPLRAELYQADRIEQQLDDQCRRWLDDRSKNRAIRQSLGVSEIFKWHHATFEAEPYNGTVGFLRKFGRPHGEIRDYISGMNESVKLTYLPYDWRLNWSPEDRPTSSRTPATDSHASSQPSHE